MPAPRFETRAQVRQQLAQLPERCFEEIERNRDLFVRRLQTVYGMTADEAKREVDRSIATPG